MVDVHTPAQRSRNMAAIRSKNSKPELVLRRALHGRGFRFRLHSKALPGKPDVVLRRYHTAIFVHGCFFHGHECPAFKWPRTRTKFWREKIEQNQSRDIRVKKILKELGWRVTVIWECELRGRSGGASRAIERLVFRLEKHKGTGRE